MEKRAVLREKRSLTSDATRYVPTLQHDRRENEFSVKHGFRVLSAYRTAKDVRLRIITEADRSSTTILLPEEY